MEILYLLLPVALVMSLVATGLFLTGFVTPHWFHVHPPGANGTVHYGVFVICHEDTRVCQFWRAHELDEGDVHGQRTPVGSGASELLLSMNAIALVESAVILLWCLCKSCTRYWVKSAYNCTLSGVLYGVLGTATFLGVRMHIENATSEKFKDPHRLVSLAWSAILVVTSVVILLLTALCLKLALLCSMTTETEPNSNSLLLSLQPLQPPEAQCDKSLGQLSGMTLNDRKKRSSVTPSMESVSSDLLRLVQKQRQTDKSRPTLSVTRTVGTYQGRPPRQGQGSAPLVCRSRLSTLKELSTTSQIGQHTLSSLSQRDDMSDFDLEKKESLQFNELMELFNHPEVEMMRECSSQTDLGNTVNDADERQSQQANQKGCD